MRTIQSFNYSLNVNQNSEKKKCSKAEVAGFHETAKIPRP